MLAGCCSQGSPSICMGTESDKTSCTCKNIYYLFSHFNYFILSILFLLVFFITSVAWPTLWGSLSPTCIWAMWKLEKTQKTCRENNIESTRTELVMTSHLQLFIRDAGCEVEVSMSGAESPGPDPRTPAGNVQHHH